LVEHLVQFFTRQTGRPILGVSDEAKQAILRYPWPGNLRELRNAVERGVILATDSVLGLADLPTQIGSPPPPGVEVGSRVTLEQLEAEHIRRVLARSATIDEASGILGIDPSTLYRKRKRYGL
jgi:NtrC-family two-component system response regulator AlgB